MPTERTAADIATTILRVIIYATILVALWRFNRRPSLRGCLTYVLLSMFHSLVYALVFELVTRNILAVPVDLLRMWAPVIGIHGAVATGLSLKSISDRIDALNKRIPHGSRRHKLPMIASSPASEDFPQ